MSNSPFPIQLLVEKTATLIEAANNSNNINNINNFEMVLGNESTTPGFQFLDFFEGFIPKNFCQSQFFFS